jgi:hypothetical protein
MAADLIENYEKRPDAFKFIKEVPTDWDTTVVLDAEPGDYIYIARRERNGKQWFVGAITDEQERLFEPDLSFLTPGKKYNMVIYRDGETADWEKKSHELHHRQKNHSLYRKIKNSTGTRRRLCDPVYTYGKMTEQSLPQAEYRATEGLKREFSAH